MSETKYSVNTYLPTWRDGESFSSPVQVQVTGKGTIYGHSARSFEECWPHLSSRDVWENSPLYHTMVQEAIANRERQIDALTK